MRRLSVLVLLLSAALASCGGDDETGSRRSVAAAFYPLAWATEQIGGDGVDVVNLTPPGGEPHDVELSPRDVATILDAELVIYVSSGFQPAVEDAVARRDGLSLDVLDGESNPHVWVDPVRFAAIAEEIGEALDEPDAARELADEIERLDAEYRSALSGCARKTIVTTHEAFTHLVARYGLEQLSLTGRAPEAEPSPRELERLIDDVRKSGATTVFAEPLVSDRVAETVAREAGAEVAVLDPLEGLSDERLAAGEDYLSVMRENLVALRRALGCR